MTFYRCLFYYALIGPFLGSFFVWVVGPYLFGGTLMTVDPIENLVRLGASTAAALTFFGVALLFGFVPGAVTGIVYWGLLKRTAMVRMNVLLATALMGMVGALACAVFAVATVGAGANQLRELMVGFVLPGYASAATIALGLHRKQLKLAEGADASSPQRTNLR